MSRNYGNNNKNYYKQLDQVELIELCQKDDREALEELLRRTKKPVYSMLYHLDPKRDDIADLTQEVLFKVAKSIKSLRSPKTFKFWLNQIITNLFYDELRKKTRRPPMISMDVPYSDHNEQEKKPARDIIDPSKAPDENTLGRELDSVIKDAINNLSEQFRLVIVLREIQGLSYEEIAEITNTNIGTVKSRLARARAKLQELLKPYLS